MSAYGFGGLSCDWFISPYGFSELCLWLVGLVTFRPVVKQPVGEQSNCVECEAEQNPSTQS